MATGPVLQVSAIQRMYPGAASQCTDEGGEGAAGASGFTVLLLRCPVMKLAAPESILYTTAELLGSGELRLACQPPQKRYYSLLI